MTSADPQKKTHYEKFVYLEGIDIFKRSYDKFQLQSTKDNEKPVLQPFLDRDQQNCSHYRLSRQANHVEHSRILHWKKYFVDWSNRICWKSFGGKVIEKLR